MPAITSSVRDVIWSYAGTVLSYSAGFVQLPILIYFLSPDDLGLWYAFSAFAGLISLFEFGFAPAFSRNIVYVLSGARSLERVGLLTGSVRDDVDWHLFRTVVATSKLVYAALAFVALLVASTVGSFYVGYISRGIDVSDYWIAWVIFCVAIFFNLLFLHYITLMEGIGDIAGMNRAKSISRVLQLIVTVVLLIAGFGLVGAALGFLTNGVFVRVACRVELNKHDEISASLKSGAVKIMRSEIIDTISKVSFLAWRDGLMQLCYYLATQASIIICSVYLSLADTGLYSATFQVAQAVSVVSGAYAQSKFPSHQSAYARGDSDMQKRILSECAVAYWCVASVGVVGAIAVVFPILSIVKPEVDFDTAFFLLLSCYLLLWGHGSVFASFILNTNRIPYMRAYIVSAVLSVSFEILLVGFCGLGVWGIVLGQLVVQLSYNNWKWPRYAAMGLNETYLSLLRNGVKIAKKKILSRARRLG